MRAGVEFNVFINLEKKIDHMQIDPPVININTSSVEGQDFFRVKSCESLKQLFPESWTLKML